MTSVVPIDQLSIGETGVKLKRKVSHSLEDLSIIYTLTEEEIEEEKDEVKKENILHVDYLKEIYEVNLKH